MNRIKLNSSGMQAATPGEGDGSKRASSRSGVQRLKVSARPASGQRKVSAQHVIKDAQIIFTGVQNKVTHDLAKNDPSVR